MKHRRRHYTPPEGGGGGIQTIVTNPPILGGGTGASVPLSFEGERNGFPVESRQIAKSKIDFDNITKIFTLEHISDYDVWVDGVKETVTEDKTLEMAGMLLEGFWFVVMNTSFELQASQTPFELLPTLIPVAMFTWDATNSKALGLHDKRYGMIMDNDTHKFLTEQIGMLHVSGLAITNDDTIPPVNNGGSCVLLESGYGRDDDIKYQIVNDSTPTNPWEQNLGTNLVTDPALLPVFYRSGASNWRRYDNPEKVAFYHSGGNTKAHYNQWTGAVWQMTAITDKDWCVYWVCQCTSQTEPIFLIPHTEVYASQAEAESGATIDSIKWLDYPLTEVKVLYRLLIEAKDAYTLTTHRSVVRVIDDYRRVVSPPLSGFTSQIHSALSGKSFAEAGHTGFQPDIYQAGYNPSANHDSVDTAGEGRKFYFGNWWVNFNTKRVFYCDDPTPTLAHWSEIIPAQYFPADITFAEIDEKEHELNINGKVELSASQSLDLFLKWVNGRLQIIGDTRPIVGKSWQGGTTVYSYDSALFGSGTISFSRVGDTITVNTTGTQPNFASLVDGNKCAISRPSGVGTDGQYAEYEVLSATGNSITFKTTPPDMAAGDVLTIIPNIRLSNTGTTIIRFADRARVYLECVGIAFENPGGICVSGDKNSDIEFYNCCFLGSNSGIVTARNRLWCADTVSFIGMTSDCVKGSYQADCTLDGCQFAVASSAVTVEILARFIANYCFSSFCFYGFFANRKAIFNAQNAYANSSAIAFYAWLQSNFNANGTSGKATNNTQNYSPSSTAEANRGCHVDFS